MKDWKSWCRELGNYPGEGGIQKIQADARDSALEEAAQIVLRCGCQECVKNIRDLKTVPKPCEHSAYTIHRGIGGQEKQKCVNCPMYRFVRMVPDCEWRMMEEAT